MLILSFQLLGQGNQSFHRQSIISETINCVQKIVAWVKSTPYTVIKDPHLPVKLTTPKYSETYSLDSIYHGEDIGLSGAVDGRVLYLNSLSLQDQYRVGVFKDRIRWKKRWFTSNDSEQETFIYVMDIYGNLYMGQGIVDSFHHSSFLSGEEVASAGKLTIVKGKIFSINNHSGHYSPNEYSIFQTIEEIFSRASYVPEQSTLRYLDDEGDQFDSLISVRIDDKAQEGSFREKMTKFLREKNITLTK